MRIIGLTGGIASGKSTVSKMLRELGAAVVDSDEGARAVVEPGQPALAEIRQEFGDGVIGPGDRLDRSAMAARVFEDEAARRRLQEITWPRVQEWTMTRLAEAEAAGAELAFLDTPLLFEAGLNQGLAETVVVWVPVEAQVQRAIDRGMDETDVRARVRAQLPLDEKRSWATHVIDNSGSPEQTRRQVLELWRELQARGGS